MSGGIDIEGSTLACSLGDVRKLTSDDGCPINIINHHQVLSLDDEKNLDEAEDLFDDSKLLPESEKRRQAIREYLSLILNANRDPIKPGPRTKLTKALEYGEDIITDDYEVTQASSLDSKHSKIHKKYENLANYEDIISDPEKKFESMLDGLVYKKTTVAGSGPIVTWDSLVIYNCALWTEGCSNPFDSTWLRQNVNFCNMGHDSVLPGLYELLLTCRKDEWCEAFIRPEAAFGKLGALPRIPANATIFCVLEVVKVLSKDKLSIIANNGCLQLAPFEDLFDTCDEARKRGNHYYEQKQYKTALQRYKSGIRIMEGATFMNADEEKKGKALLVKLYNNSAKASNQSGLPRLALAACKEAFLVGGEDPKTHWHRISAWELMGHTEKALGNTRWAMQLFKDDPKTHSLFSKRAEALKDQLRKERIESDDLYRLMGKARLS